MIIIVNIIRNKTLKMIMMMVIINVMIIIMKMLLLLLIIMKIIKPTRNIMLQRMGIATEKMMLKIMKRNIKTIL